MTKLAIIPALAVGSLYLIRRKISSKWIHVDTSEGSASKFNLNGKVCVVTGGNTGLGFVTAKELARLNGTVVLACRDVEKGKRAVNDIIKSTGNVSVGCVKLDLADLDSVRSFRSDLTEQQLLLPSLSSLKNNNNNNNNGNDVNKKGIYALVCNAGVWVPMENQQKTRDNFEIHFGVNHLGHFLLIQNLMPLLQTYNTNNNSGNSAADANETDDDDDDDRTNSSRIVIVSSGLMKSGKIDFEKKDFIYEGRTPSSSSSSSSSEGENKDKDKKKKSHAPTGYCDSKLMNALTCRHIMATNNYNTNRNRDDDTTTSTTSTVVPCYAVCPGWCYTELARNVYMPLYMKILVSPFAFFFMRTSTQGAQNILFATLTKASTITSTTTTSADVCDGATSTTTTNNDDVKLIDGGFYRDGKIAPVETNILESLTTTTITTTTNNNNNSANSASTGGDAEATNKIDYAAKLWTLSEKLIAEHFTTDKEH